ncbi:MAG TPA: glycosyl transferase [Stellaceae bacterium]|nr:glycosyl transferase [Stellaceae bacterium]
MAGGLAGARPYALLSALCLLLYLPGLATIPPLDRDEARFAQASRQMLQTGDFIRIRFQDEARDRKPAGIYWLQAAAVAVLSTAESTAIWPYRLPSVAGAGAAVLMVFAFATALFRADPAIAEPRRAAFAAALLLAASLGLVAEAHIAKTDAVLLATIVAGQAMLGLAYLRARRGAPVPLAIAAGFWVAEAAAILIKGPVGPGVALLTAAALSIADREARWLGGLRPVRGVILVAVLLAPWLIAIERATAGQFLAHSLGRDFLAKLIGAQESHGAPPLTYLLLALVTFWPGSLWLARAAIGGWRRRETAARRFLLAWLVPYWLVIELVPTKLPNYALPVYPALALLAAAAIADGAAFVGSGWARWVDCAVRGLWALVTLALAAALVALPLWFAPHFSALGIAGAVLIIAGAAALWRRPNPAGAAALAAVFALALGIGVAPGLDRLWLSRSAATLVALHPPRAGAPLVAVGYDEPSLVFLLGTGLHLGNAAGAAVLLARGGEVLVSDREQAELRRALTARGLAARALGSVSGTDYSNGRHMVITLYDVEPG